MPRRAPLPPGSDPREHPALKGGHVVILGGEAPKFKSSGAVGHAALGQMLETKGFDYEPCHGKYEGDKQPSYIVHVRNDGEDETLKGIAKRMGQEAIVHSEGGKHQLVYLNGDNAGKATAPAAGLEWYGDNEPDDNYTTLYGASGEPLGHFKYNMDFDQPMVPDGPGPMVDVPEAAQQVLKSAVESYRGILLDLRKRETEKIQALEKPPVSEAQRRLVHARAAEGEGWAKEWAAADKPGKLPEHKKAEWNPTPNLMSVRDQHTGSHPDGSSLSPNKASHPFSEPTRATTGGAIDGRIAKYMTEGGQKSKVRGNKPSSDISTQGPRTPSAPFSTNVVASAATTRKTEGDYQHIRRVREAEERELSQIPMRDPNAKPWPKDSGRPVPSLAEERAAAQTKKTETPMKLHDLMKSQAANYEMCPDCEASFKVPKGGSLPEHKFNGKRCEMSGKPHAEVKKDEFPTTNKFSNKLAEGREQSSVEGSPAAAGAKSAFTQRATTPSSPNAFKAEESMDKAQCTCGLKDCQYCGKAKPKQGNEQGEHGGGPKKPSYQPGDEIKKSIFKKMPEMSKAETVAHATAKRNGGTIKLGKQEFYIDHQNPTAPQKDDPTSSIPGGKETGWRNGGDKSKVIEVSASGGAISGNKPKAGPDQKNAPENSAVTGTVPKSSGKNDLIEKAASDFHKRTGGRFQKKPASDTAPASDYYNEKSKTESGVHSSVAQEVKKASSFGGKFKPSAGDTRGEQSPPQKPASEESWFKEGEKMGKAAPSMGAPKAPSAAGAGSPTLSGGAPTKPPAAHASANPKAFGKAVGDFGGQSARGTPGAGQKPGFDPSITAPPRQSAAGVTGTPEFQVKQPSAAPGGFRSPAQHRGISGFLGKGELCKACGKSHKLGKCA